MLDEYEEREEKNNKLKKIFKPPTFTKKKSPKHVSPGTD
jgi:hypothetical protein